MSKICQKLEESDGLKCGIIYEVIQVFIKKNAHIYKGRKICELFSNDPESTTRRHINIKAKSGGVISKLIINAGDKVSVGHALLEVEVCTHPTVLGNICCDCGVVLEDNIRELEENKTNGLVSMLHSIPDLKVSKEEAKRLGKEDINNLLDHRKLVLLVDLDQTLIHTTNDNIPPKLKDVFHFQLIPNGPWYHTRLRPFAKNFLQRIAQYYELHICTFGVREYAHYIAHFLDEDRKLFGDRILSRNECLDPMSKKANLSSLFPCGDNLVCIIDDRSDVWNFAPNVVQVMPYHFFQHTGDINAPPGLQKMENDESSKGFDFTKLEETESKKEELKRKRDSDDEDDENSSHKRNKTTYSDESSQSCTSSSNSSEGATNKAVEEINESEKSTNTESKEESAEVLKSKEDSEETLKSKEDSEETLKSKEDSEETVKSKEDSEETLKSKEEQSVETTKDSEEKVNEEDVIDVEDNDDYLLYLEDILKRLHEKFYAVYDAKENLPDLKDIIPNERNKVLNGCHLVFSCIVPHHTKFTESKAYHIATSLGATVSEQITSIKDKKNSNVDKSNLKITTHLIAANLHTEKVHHAKKMKNIKIVTPNWLWCCAERWEKVDERLFLLNKESEENICRNPPIHCFVNVQLNQHDPTITETKVETLEPEKSKEYYSLFGSLNPLAYLSDDEAKSMEEEVDGELGDDDEDTRDNVIGAESSDSDDESKHEDDSSKFPPLNSDSEEENKRRRRRSFLGADDEDEEEEESEEEEEELPSIRFRRGGALSSSNDSDDSVDEDMNAYGDILAKELMD